MIRDVGNAGNVASSVSAPCVQRSAAENAALTAARARMRSGLQASRAAFSGFRFRITLPYKTATV